MTKRCLVFWTSSVDSIDSALRNCIFSYEDDEFGVWAFVGQYLYGVTCLYSGWVSQMRHLSPCQMNTSIYFHSYLINFYILFLTKQLESLCRLLCAVTIGPDTPKACLSFLSLILAGPNLCLWGVLVQIPCFIWNYPLVRADPAFFSSGAFYVIWVFILMHVHSFVAYELLLVYL